MENRKTRNSNKIVIKIFNEIERDWRIASIQSYRRCEGDDLENGATDDTLRTRHIKPSWRETQNMMMMMIIMISSSHPFF